MKSQLSKLQMEFLEGFFASESRFYLTGGAALAGFYLGHRTTEDLDLFVSEPVLEDAEAVLRQVAASMGASIEKTRTSPDFRRRLLRRGSEGLVIDLVFDRAPRGPHEQRFVGKVRIDPPEEIMANKLCALLGRCELRDLVDVQALERAGYSLESALEVAQSKDGGLTSAQLAWVLSQMAIDDAAEIPGNLSPRQLREYSQDLQDRLLRSAFPATPGPSS